MGSQQAALPAEARLPLDDAPAPHSPRAGGWLLLVTKNRRSFFGPYINTRDEKPPGAPKALARPPREGRPSRAPLRTVQDERRRRPPPDLVGPLHSTRGTGGPWALGLAGGLGRCVTRLVDEASHGDSAAPSALSDPPRRRCLTRPVGAV